MPHGDRGPDAGAFAGMRLANRPGVLVETIRCPFYESSMNCVFRKNENRMTTEMTQAAVFILSPSSLVIDIIAMVRYAMS